ncbi:MAG: class I tRNA ligase family protein [Candidatus Limnocylindrales bacterium]
MADATHSFEEYDYARALARAESFFWWYCDFYLELVKGRRYDSDPQVSASVSRALRLSLSVFQRLFAPFGRYWLIHPKAFWTLEFRLSKVLARGAELATNVRTRDPATAAEAKARPPCRCGARKSRPRQIRWRSQLERSSAAWASSRSTKAAALNSTSA